VSPAHPGDPETQAAALFPSSGVAAPVGSGPWAAGPSLHNATPCAVGIDIGSPGLCVLVVDQHGRILAERRDVHSPPESLDRRFALAGRLVSELLDIVDATRRLTGVGVAVPGLAGALTTRLPGDVRVDHAGNLAALAEARFGAAVGVRHLIYVRLEAEIVAAGVILDGHVFRGARGLGGGRGLVAADHDSGGGLRVLADACTLLGPELLVIAGSRSVQEVAAALARRAPSHIAATVEIRRAVLGDRAAAIGAATHVMTEVTRTAHERMQ
jgi:predicted NBD/HSP70 family sugar kinase